MPDRNQSRRTELARRRIWHSQQMRTLHAPPPPSKEEPPPQVPQQESAPAQ